MDRHEPLEYRIRSLTKAITYRIIILVLDFAAVFFLTGRYEVALGFMIVSNVYTSIAYYFHERVWSGIAWGRKVTAG
ncbi:MAG: DUF2061 domain-containing protein [Methanomicrobiales archaeon]|nr:DUF2061 domain-containing protein [Methanomicrobiales archaeon]